MKNRKRILSLLLILCMCFSLLPLPAFAGDGEEDVPGIEETQDLPASKLSEEDGEDELCEHEPAGAVTENAVAPSCTEPGSHDTVVYCALCGEELSRETVEDPALGHTPEDVEAAEPTCTEPGHTAGRKCAVCGAVLEGCEEIAAPGHTPKDVEAVAPTYTEPGHTAGVVCSVCGAILDGFEELPALEGKPTLEDEAVVADTPADDAETSEAQYFTYINPVYADIIDESDLPTPPSPEELASTYGSATIYTDFDAAADALREQFVQRQATPTVSYRPASGEDAGGLLDAFHDAVFSHTGVGTEGDSLYYTYGGCTCGMSYESGYYTYSYSPLYYTTAAQENELNDLVPTILSKLNLGGKSDYQKLAAIYDYLCQTVTYDHAHLGDSSYKLQFTGYAALVNHTAVCQGISVAFYRLCLDAGLDARVISCRNMCHAWNIALCPNGNYYSLDATWNLTETGFSYHYFFLRGSTWWLANHDYNGVSEMGDQFKDNDFAAAYPHPGTDYSPSAADTHKHSLKHVAAVASTCQKQGNREYWYCSGCGKYFNDAAGTQETTLAALTLPLAPHEAAAGSHHPAVPPTASEPGNVEYWICKYCNKPINAQTGGSLIEDVTVPATGILESGSCGPNLSWKVDIEGVLTISGTGAMTNYSSADQVPWKAYRDSILRVVLKSGVTGIGSYAFFGCRNLKNANLPAGLKTIGAGAFQECASLSAAELPAGLTDIGQDAFNACTALARVTIPASVIHIGLRAFHGCSVLTAIGVDAGSSSFSSDARGVLFSKDRKTLIEAPGALSGTYVIPADVTGIGIAAFAGCAGLTEVTIPRSVTSIGQSAFVGCGLTDVYYSGTRTEWDAITIGDDNRCLTDAALHILAYTISYDANGGADAPEPQIKTRGTALTLSGKKPIRDGYTFLGWAADPNASEAQYRPGASYTAEGDATLFAVWRVRLTPEDMTLDQEYLLLAPGETAQLALEKLPAEWAPYVTWSSDKTGVATVNASGLVTAAAKGTAWIKASVDTGEDVLSAACRIDVTASPAAEVTGVRLPITKATVELYRSDYTEIPVELLLAQNQQGAAGSAVKPIIIPPTDPGPKGGVSITSASFTDPNAAAVFDLHVKDDRTLEVIPKPEFVTTDAAKLKTLKSSYKSAIAVTVDGKEFTTGVLTLSVKKSVPKTAAKAVKLNSFLADTQQVVFTGTAPEAIRVSSCPPWLTAEADGGSLSVTMKQGEYRFTKQSGKLSLMVRPAGWTLELPVTVAVSAAKTGPKLKFSPATLNLQAGVGDSAETTVSLTPAALAETELRMTGILEGKASRNNALKVEINDKTITVSEGSGAPKDGKAHTYKVMISAGGDKPVALTVKLLAANTVKLTAKAVGSIDLALKDCPVTIVPTTKGYGGEPDYWISGIFNASGSEVSGLFRTDGLQILAAGSPAPGNYSAELTAMLGNGTTKSVRVRFTVKRSTKAPTANVTLKASGSIDVLRPDTAIVLTPTVKNHYGHELTTHDLVIYRINGKTRTAVGRGDEPNRIPFAVSMEDGVYTLTQSRPIDHRTEKYAAGLSFDGIGTKAPVNLTVKMGASKITQDVKSVTLLKDDRFDRTNVKLTVVNPEYGGIARVVLVSPTDKSKRTVFALTDLGGGEYAIGYNGNRLPAAGFKGGTVKLQVFLEGNRSSTPNATLNVNIKLN